MTHIQTLVLALVATLTASCAAPLETDGESTSAIIDDGEVTEPAVEPTEPEPISEPSPTVPNVEPPPAVEPSPTVLAGVTTPTACEEPNRHAPATGKCLVIEGRFEIHVWAKANPNECVRWDRTFKCLSTDLPVFVVGEATVTETAPNGAGYCELCASDYIPGAYVTAKYAEGR